MSGTSMATPHVSGAAALYWGIKPQAPATEVGNYLRSTRAIGSNRSKDGDALRLLRAEVAPPQGAPAAETSAASTLN